ncbi:MAG: bifunctional phosphopantothenoylcysteine decarboxylase/phosphopantothenate--cysteine ligase CoaBC [Acidobacteria bacterium]|nr:bifunctional phosphopantothenoylcysteine decarboxylase/phosphopantothenate--cysteine ligase CoaBC [Acidobacteriota bacterium]
MPDSGPAQAPRIVLGVCGGIAAYKSAELARRLQDRGFRVQAAMTAHAREFITPLTFAALTGEKVVTDLFATASGDETLQSAIEHIEVARRADLLLIAPATADMLAKLAHGLADDFLSTMHLAYTGPVLVAPAMNVNMWAHPATQANMATLRARGVHVVEPEAGSLACGMTGPGRLAETELIVAAAEALLRGKSDFSGRTVLITAGPTREPLDPVRYISNRSSGRMGYALAEEALARGARVILVSGPTAMAAPAGAETVWVEAAAEMYEATVSRLDQADVMILAAAVADYRPAQAAAQKMKKSEDQQSLALEPTQDILAECGRRKGARVLVGFAAETENLEANARGKLERKGCDLLVANLVGQAGTGFDSAENEGLLLKAGGGAEALPRESKRAMAGRILDAVAALRS